VLSSHRAPVFDVYSPRRGAAVQRVRVPQRHAHVLAARRLPHPHARVVPRLRHHRVGLALFTLFCKSKHIKSKHISQNTFVTVSMVHVNKLTPGSDKSQNIITL
jgi:hypothetical protein